MTFFIKHIKSIIAGLLLWWQTRRVVDMLPGPGEEPQQSHKDMGTQGIQAIKRAFTFLFANAITISQIDQNNDGKVDNQERLRILMALIPLWVTTDIKNIVAGVKGEIGPNELTPEELLEIVNWTQGNFPNLGANVHEIEALAKAIIFFLAATLGLVYAIKDVVTPDALVEELTAPAKSPPEVDAAVKARLPKGTAPVPVAEEGTVEAQA